MRSGSCEGQFPRCHVPFGLTQKKGNGRRLNPLKSRDGATCSSSFSRRFSFFQLRDIPTVQPSHKIDSYLWMFRLSSTSSKPQRSEWSALLDLFCKQRRKLYTPKKSSQVAFKNETNLRFVHSQTAAWILDSVSCFKKVFHLRRREDCTFYKRTKISCCPPNHLTSRFCYLAFYKDKNIPPLHTNDTSVSFI